jgi:hypothetical protein
MANSVITLKAPGQLVNEASSIPVDQAGVVLTFEKQGAMVFLAQDCVTRRIENVADVASQILELQRRQLWPEDFVLISDVVRAASVLVLVAERDEAIAEIASTRYLAPADITFGSIVAESRIAAQSGIALAFLSHGPSTPFFRASRIGSRRRTGGGTRSVVAAEGETNGEDERVEGGSAGADFYEVVPGAGLPDE